MGMKTYKFIQKGELYARYLVNTFSCANLLRPVRLWIGAFHGPMNSNAESRLPLQ